MKLYAPLSFAAEKLRLLFQRRIQDAELAYLGNGQGRVDIPDMKGYVYARFADGADNNGNTLYSTPFAVRSAGAAYLNYEGTGVYVAYGRNNELQIVEAHYATMDQAGMDTRVLNPLNQQSRFVYLWQITIGKCSAVATTINDSYLVTVKNFLHYVNNRFQFFETALQADKLSLSAYNPTTDQHRYAAVWVDTYGNVAEVTTSISQSLFTPLDVTDIQELVASRPPDATPHQAFYLANNQGTVTQQPAVDVDLRQFLNMPQIIGFQSPVAYRERIQPDRQQLFTGALQVTGSLQVLGLLHGIPAPAQGGSGGIGTVTSVGLTMPSGFSVSGSPVTGSGTLAVTGTPLVSRLLSTSMTIPDTYNLVVSSYYEIASGVTLTLEGDAELEIL